MKLKNHTLIILSLFLMLFVCIGSVSALESQTDNIGENNVICIGENLEILTDSASDDAVGVSSDENVISSDNRDWYVNASAADGGDGSNISPYKNFRSVLDNIDLQDGDSVYFAGKENYKGDGINVNLNISKKLNLLKYGSGEAVFDAEHNSRIFTVSASCINITGLAFINGNADNGGAIYFNNDISNSNINAIYTNNTAAYNGGANHFHGSVLSSNISGTYINNKADHGGGANFFLDSVSGSNINGTYTYNKANGRDDNDGGGANYFKKDVSNSNITGTYNNNSADGNGGTNRFNTVFNSNIAGTYNNNSADGNGGTNCFNTVFNSNIAGTYNNNSADGNGGVNCIEIYVLNSNITGTYNHNTAVSNGGANYFGSSVSSSNISGTYINNTATYCGANYLNNVSSSNISGTYINNTATDCGANYLNNVSSSNISGTYINNTANNGGANYFGSSVSSSNISGTYINNTAEFGGANFFVYNVSGSTINGTYSNNTAEFGGANFFFDSVSGSTINGTYSNNTAEYDGGANYFLCSVSGSTINGTYSNNTAEYDGGANYFLGSVSGSTITGTYNYNNATNGGANYFRNSVTDSNITGTYNHNTAINGNGGANFFLDSVSGSTINGTYTNNTANTNGGANHFQSSVLTSNVGGIYINNTASNAIIHFENLFNQDSDVYITNAIFLNNNCTYEIYASTPGVKVKDSWFGNNASNYMNKPNINDNVTIDNWLFLNATADCTSLLILNSSNITFKLYSTDGTKVSDFDNSRLPVVNLTLAATNGEVDNTTTLDNIVKYIATEQGKGSVTAKIENASYTIYFNNILRNVDLSVSAENITYLENEILTLSYNNTATGKVNITLKSKNYNKTIEADINQTITITDLPVGEYDVTVEYLGDNVFSNATSYANFTVEKRTTEVIPDKESIELFVDDEYKITYTLKPDYALGNISFSSNDSSIVSVDSVLGNIWAKAEGSVSITISFSGSENYAASNATVTVNVKRIPTKIAVNSSFIDMKVNDETDIGASLEPSNAGNLTYKSSDEDIVKVENGKIKGLKEGNATITVSFAGNNKYLAAENKTINVTVRLNDASVSVNNNTLNLFVDDTFNLIATTEPKGLTVNYTSSNPSVVTVDNKGNVIALSEGNATIIVTVGGDGIYAENSTTVTVTVIKVPTEISINPASLNLLVGDETVIAANLTPSDAGNVTFTSSDENIVTVDDKGNVIAEGKGQAIITVSFAGDNKYAAAENKTITVTVSLNDASVTVDNDTLDLKVDETYKINATKHPDTILLDITYTSSNESVATVDKNGVVTAHGEGTAIITLEVGDDEIYAKNSTAVTVTVSKIPTEINIENATVTLNVGDEVSTGAALNPKNAGNLTYKSDDESIAIVKDGKIIALKEGNMIITVGFKGDNKYAAAKNKTIKVTVKKVNALMNVSAEDITEGENTTINVALPDDATGNVTTKVNGKTYSSPVENGKAVITIPYLEHGNYTLPVTYSGDDKYNPIETNVNVTVNPQPVPPKENLTISAIANPIAVGEDAVIVVTGFEDATGNVTVTVNGKTYIVSIDEGKATITVPGLTENASATVSYSGDDKYNSASTIVDIVVNPAPEPDKDNLTISASAEPITVGDNATIVVTGLENATGDISVIVKGKTYTAHIMGGEATVTVPGLTENVVAIVNYVGDDLYNPASTTVNITVSPKEKENATISIDAPAEVTEGDSVTVTVTLPKDATGTVTIGNEVVPVQNGTASAVLTNLSVGDNNVSVTYSGDDKYNSIETSVVVTVDEKPVPPKENLTIIASADPITVGDNATIVVTGLKDATGNVTVAVNGKSYVVPIVKGAASVTVSGLTRNVTAVVSYLGDSKYNNASTTVDIVVNPKPKENATINIDVPPVSEGQNTTVNVELPKDATGNVTAVVDGKTYTAQVNGGKATIFIPDLAAGNYTVPVTYSGDNKYNPLSEEVKITVDEDKSDIINAPNVTKYFSGPERFVVTVTDYQGNPLANKSVTISINGRSYERTTDANGTASIALGLNSGVYNATVTVDNKIINSVVTILSTVNGTDIIKVFRNGTQYFATFRDGEGNYLKDGETVIFNIHGVMYERKVSGDKGLARLNINLEAGEYVITAMNPITCDKAANNITVLSRITENADLVKYYRNASQYTVKVIGDDGKAVGAGESVTFNINGVFYTRQTDANGTVKLNINLQPGDYVITSEYKGCLVSNNIKVLPVLTASDISMKYRDGTQFRASLVDGQGKPYVGQSVQFNINGVLYNRITGSDGMAKLNINLMPGEYIITSSYNGSSIANKITIRG